MTPAFNRRSETGQITFERTYGGTNTDFGCSVEQTQDGGYIIAGWTASFGAGRADVYLVKTDENGLMGIEERGTGVSTTRQRCELFQNHPSPFDRSTFISYSLLSITQVTLSIHDIAGRLVETLVNETQQPGIHQVHWDRKSNPSGVCFYQLRAEGFVETRKMVAID